MPATGSTGSTTSTPLRVAAYVRYSSRTQRDGYSIEAQRAAIEAEARAWEARDGNTGQGWRITWYEEPERSARAEKLAKRVVFRQMMEAAAAGQIDLVVVHKLDRFARSLAHQLQFINELARHSAGFYSVVEKPDFTSPQGRLIAHMFGALAQFYSDNLGQEVKKGLDERAKAGLAWGPPPFGYRPRTGDDGDLKGPPVPDERDWDGYQEIKRLVLAGYSDSAIARELNADGRWRPNRPSSSPRWKEAERAGTDWRPWTFWAVRKIRTNPFYGAFEPGDDRGAIHVNGERYRGQHVAAATWDEWQTMQTIFHTTHGWYGGGATRTGEAARSGYTEFLGLASCAVCGERLYVIHSYGRTRDADGQRVVYEQLECPAYRWHADCPVAGGRVRARDVTGAWLEWLRARFIFPSDWEARITAEYEARLRSQASQGAPADGDGNSGNGAERQRLTVDLKHWRERRQAAIDARLDGWIEASEARERVAEADRELARIRVALERLDAGGAAGRDDLRALLLTAHQAQGLIEVWPDMTRDERRRAAALMLSPLGLQVRVPPRGRQGAHTPDRLAHVRAVVGPEASLVDLIAGVRLRPDFARLLDMLGADGKERVAQ